MNRSFHHRRRRAAARRRATAVIAVFAVVLVAMLALHSLSREPTAPLQAMPLRTDSPKVENVVYKQREPAAPWTAQQRSSLQAALASALEPGVRDAGAWSCVVIAQDGSLLYDDRGDSAVTPASVQKLIVSDAALTDLGPRFRFDTLLAAKQRPQNGTITGDLWLDGSGDPTLRSSDLRFGVEALRRSGVDHVGRVVIDASAVSGEEINPLWNPNDANEDFMAPTSGISLDEDTVEFHVTGTSAGEAAAVRIEPQSRGVHYYGSVMSGGGDDVIVAATETPNLFRLSGNVPPGVEETFYVPVHGMPAYAGAVVQRLLKTDGIAVAHTPAVGETPIDADVLWDHRSKPLTDILHHMLVVSDNHFAEQLMRTVGAVDGGAPGDAGGLAEERRVLREQAIPTPGLHIVDGSGLAHANRVSAMTLARILAHADADPKGNVLYGLLPRGGVDGTLKMYDFTSAAGRVRAKTGHVDGVSSLAGYVNTRKHGRVVFAFLVNGSPGDPDAAIVQAVDQLAQR